MVQSILQIYINVKNTKINEIEEKKKKFGNLWRKIDTRIYSSDEKPYTSKYGDIFIFERSHIASLLKKIDMYD